MIEISEKNNQKKGSGVGRKIVTAVITAGMLLSMTACGTQQEAQNGQETENEIADNAVVESTGEIDVIEVTEDIICDVDNLSEEQKNMLGPMDSIGYTLDNQGVTYGADDAEYVWLALFDLISSYSYDLAEKTDAVQISEDPDGYGVYVTEDFVKECVSAMFPDFDGNLPPCENANVTEEGDQYLFKMGDRGEEYAHISSWIEHPDGTCTVETEIRNEYGSELIAEDEIFYAYRFELIGNAYTETELDPIYIYSVASVEMIYDWAAEGNGTADDSYILPESDSRYYTESELRGLTKDELRLARNEIYARHGRMFDSEDLQNYFGGKAWYNGTISADDFSESMLNEYEKANIETIEKLEGNETQSTSGGSGFTFADIAGRTFTFSSGAGGWADELTVQSDGTFSGLYYNYYGADEMNGIPESYYWCEYSGKFSEPTKVNDYTYSTKVESVELLYAPDTEEMVDDILYQYVDEGFEIGEEITIYLPGASTAEIPEDVLSWLYGIADGGTLTSYVLDAQYKGAFY